MPTVASWIEQLNKKSQDIERESDDDDSEDEDWVPTEEKKDSKDESTNQLNEMSNAKSTEPAEPVESEAKQEDDRKRKADLWSSFLKDVKGPKLKVAKTVSEVEQKDDIEKTSTFKNNSDDGMKVEKSAFTSGNADRLKSTGEKFSSNGFTSDLVEVKRVYDFAGEEIVVTEKVACSSKEVIHQTDLRENDRKVNLADNELSTAYTCRTGKPQIENERPDSNGATMNTSSAHGKVGIEGSRLGSIVGSLGKKKKMGTLQKSALDWESFKNSQGEHVREELNAHRRSKNSFLDRQDFLQRVDWAQFEIERDVRSKERKRTGQNL